VVHAVILRFVSRLRRLVLSDRFFFLTCRVHRSRGKLSESDFACPAGVVREPRHGFCAVGVFKATGVRTRGIKFMPWLNTERK
jgi:hypothetical protein